MIKTRNLISFARTFHIQCIARRNFSSSTTLSRFIAPVINPEEQDFIVTSPFPDVQIPEINLSDYVWKDVDKYTDRLALVCGLTGRQYTYGMAHALSRKFGSSLVRMGAKKGDVMGMIVPNIPEFPIAFLGACGVGIVLSPMNPLYTPEEIASQLKKSEARYVITIGLFLENVRDACKLYGGIERIIVIGMDGIADDCLSFLTMIIQDDGELYGRPDESFDACNDTAVLPFSSGTMGNPKGVELTHYNMVASMCQQNQSEKMMIRGANLWHEGEQTTTLGLLPFFHIYATTTTMNLGLQSGAKIVTLPKFDPQEYINALETHKPTWLTVVPPLLGFLATNPAVTSSHLSSVQSIIGGAASFGTNLIQQLKEKCSPHNLCFRQGFGMTETSPVTHFQTEEGSILGSCGFPVPNTLSKIIDVETGKLLGPHQDGELCIAGPQVMKGYLNDEESTRRTLIDGWIHTGDVARYNEDKHFFIVERLKDLIKVKGMQVAPSELEHLIRDHPGVADVAVVGVPDERAGELPRAFIVRKNLNLSEDDVIDWVSTKVAQYKRLAGGVRFVDSLPKSQTGKILRRKLKLLEDFAETENLEVKMNE